MKGERERGTGSEEPLAVHLWGGGGVCVTMGRSLSKGCPSEESWAGLQWAGTSTHCVLSLGAAQGRRGLGTSEVGLSDSCAVSSRIS